VLFLYELEHNKLLLLIVRAVFSGSGEFLKDSEKFIIYTFAISDELTTHSLPSILTYMAELLFEYAEHMDFRILL
jgi:hypothetical protein